MLVKPANSLLRGLAPLARRHPRARDLVGWWPFGDGAGTTAADVSGFSNHGVLTNMVATTSWVTGPLGTMLDFDGSNDFVEMADRAAYYTAPFSVSFWVWLDQTAATKGEDMYFVRKRRSTGDFVQWEVIQSSSTSRCNFQVRNSASTNFQTTSDGTMAALQWYHITATVSGGRQMRLYLNGVQQADTDTPDSIITANASVLRVGANSGTAFRLDGKLHDLRIYGRELNPQEAMALTLDPMAEWRWAMQQHGWRMPLGAAATPSGLGRGSLMLMGMGR